MCGSRGCWVAAVVGAWYGSLLVTAIVGGVVFAVVVDKAGGGGRAVDAAVESWSCTWRCC